MASRFAGELKLDRAGRIALAKQAADLAEEVRRVDANNPLIYATFAGHALISGDIEGAVRAAKRRVELEPKNPIANLNLGVFLSEMGDMPGARVALEKALQFASPARRPAETYYILARVAFVEGRPDEAIKWAQQAIDANPESSFYHAQLALAYASKGDQARAQGRRRGGAVKPPTAIGYQGRSTLAGQRGGVPQVHRNPVSARVALGRVAGMTQAIFLSYASQYADAARRRNG